MKNYQSTIEGLWVEIVPVQLTEAEKALMLSMKPEDADAKKALIERIKSEREVAVNKTESAKLTSFYDSKKPALKETDTYQLIAVNLSGMDGKYKGIINCRVNGEHIQIRF